MANRQKSKHRVTTKISTSRRRKAGASNRGFTCSRQGRRPCRGAQSQRRRLRTSSPSSFNERSTGMCRRLLQVALGIVVAAPLLAAQAPTGARKGRPMTLTPADYIEIQQLAVRYSYALDTGAANGEMFASLFAPDGVFISGHDPLVALGRGRNPMYPRRFIVNHVVEPSSEGATGKVYVVEVDLPSEGEKLGGQLTSTGGRYEDVYEKTAAGWKFKSRAFVASKMAVPGAAARQ